MSLKTINKDQDPFVGNVEYKLLNQQVKTKEGITYKKVKYERKIGLFRSIFSSSLAVICTATILPLLILGTKKIKKLWNAGWSGKEVKSVRIKLIHTRDLPIDKTFQLFKKFAANPAEELYSRSLYYDAKVTEKIHVIGEKTVISSFCGDTYRGLMKALFDKKQLTEIQNDVSQIEKVQKENGKNLLNKPESFYVYGLHLGVSEFFPGKYFGGHGMIAIQYLDQDKNVRFRFFQSYVMAYSLQEYIDKGENDFSEEEFAVFLQKLQRFTSSRTWTPEMAEFHKNYFGTKDRCPLNCEMKTTIPLKMQWGECSVQDVQSHSAVYETVKKCKDFPQFILTGETDSQGRSIHNEDEEEQIVNTVYRSRGPDGTGPRCLFVTPAITVDKKVDATAFQRMQEFYKKGR